jgi:transposase
MNCTPKVGQQNQQKGCSFSMDKQREEKRKKAVLAVEAGMSIVDAARQYHVNESVLKISVRQYRAHGEEGFHTHAYSWTAEQKYQVLKYKWKNHLSIRETAIKFRVNSETIRQWEKRYREKGIMGLEDKKKGRRPKAPKSQPPKTREELIEENQYLRAENEYLKKLNALVAEREKRERGIE